MTAASTTEISNIPFLFIVGRPRSGTTLLRTLFDAHPNVIVPPECQFIVNLYPKYGKISSWTKEMLIRFHEDLQVQWRFDTWKIDQDQLKSVLLSCEADSNYGDICKMVYLSYPSLFPKEDILVIGDKNPGYTIYTERLLKIYPDAKFIHIIRDYRDNFISIKNVDFELPVPALVVSKWKYFVKRFYKAQQRNPENHLVLNYEKLVREPESVFAELCAFTGIKFHSEVFDFYKKKEEVLNIYPPDFIKKYHSSLLNKISDKNVGRWKRDLNDRQIRICDQTAGHYADLAGYNREFKGFSLWIFIQSIPGILYSKLLYLATWIVDRFPYKIRMAILSKGPLFLARVYLSIFNRKKYRELQKSIGDK